MIYFRELVTFFSLLAWIEMTTTVMNGNDCFRNDNDCSKWQRPFTKGKTASTTRMKRLWRQRPFLETVFQTTPTRRCHLLQHANQDQINALSELVLNILKRRIPLTPPRRPPRSPGLPQRKRRRRVSCAACWKRVSWQVIKVWT